MPRYRLTQVAEHFTEYEVNASTEADALDILSKGSLEGESYLGDTVRVEVKEIPNG